ncbi:ODV-E27 [Lymantria xylina nucleopolyhedrovirus]|uniref:ODV-E27 n=1 Tax=Lymantria xylina multiple nucleopolyhedrovirus TaxID=2847840 RepID=D4N2J2_9ABAC|nr:ODV-E27 [Lymantria xylina nucleopolyhedrovirus]ADD73864.1 ODV-E27 [Lymantria xylina nucleopolyhedrovirus]
MSQPFSLQEQTAWVIKKNRNIDRSKLPKLLQILIKNLDLKNWFVSFNLDTIKLRLVLVRYMLVLDALKTKRPLSEVFRDGGDLRQIASVVMATVNFVNDRFYPLLMHLNEPRVLITEDDNPCGAIAFLKNDHILIHRLTVVKKLLMNACDEHDEFAQCLTLLMMVERAYMDSLNKRVISPDLNSMTDA